MKPMALVLIALLPLAALAPAAFAASWAGCAELDYGITACGEVSDGVCGAGSGSGQATASVDWLLQVDTNHGDATDTATGPAAALAATAPCWTDTCTTVSLYANGRFIVSSMTLCM